LRGKREKEIALSHQEDQIGDYHIGTEELRAGQARIEKKRRGSRRKGE